MYDCITVSGIEQGVCTVTLNRPEKRNALSIQLRDEVTSALEALAPNLDLKVLVITGAGAVFSGGFDLKEFQEAAGEPAFHSRLWHSSDRFHHAVLYFPLPVIAAVNGPAIAGGFDLATLCDVRIASESAVFSHPEIAFGDVMYSPLHDLVGGAVARDLCLSGRTVSAAEAASLNLVAQVVSPDALGGAVRAYAASVTSAPRENLLRTKGKFLRRAQIAPGGTLTL